MSLDEGFEDTGLVLLELLDGLLWCSDSLLLGFEQGSLGLGSLFLANNLLSLKSLSKRIELNHELEVVEWVLSLSVVNSGGTLRSNNRFDFIRSKETSNFSVTEDRSWENEAFFLS